MYQDFLKQFKKVTHPRKHRATNSWTLQEIYRTFKRNNKDCSISNKQYGSIIKSINKKYQMLLSLGYDIKLPCQMGRLEIRKAEAVFKKNGQKIVYTAPIDWYRTLRLWYEDEECRKNKTIVKSEEREIYKVYYNKQRAKYNNKMFFKFSTNRNLKLLLKDNIKHRKIDAFKCRRND